MSSYGGRHGGAGERDSRQAGLGTVESALTLATAGQYIFDIYDIHTADRGLSFITKDTSVAVGNIIMDIAGDYTATRNIIFNIADDTVPEWSFYGFHTSGSSTASGWRKELSTVLAFGGGVRGAAIGTRCRVGTYCGSLHMVDDSTVTPNDTCPSPHLHVVRKAVDTVDGCYVDDSQMITLDVGTPAPGKGFMAHLSYTTEINVTDCTIWVGTGTGATGNQEGCQFWMTELNYNTPPFQWVVPSYGDALTLSSSNGIGYNHFYYFAVSGVPTAAGFHNANKFKIEAYYE